MVMVVVVVVAVVVVAAAAAVRGCDGTDNDCIRVAAAVFGI